MHFGRVLTFAKNIPISQIRSFYHIIYQLCLSCRHFARLGRDVTVRKPLGQCIVWLFLEVFCANLEQTIQSRSKF